MNEPRPQTSQRDPSGRTGAHAAPIAVDNTVVAPSPDQAEAPANRLGESSHVVYCDNDQDVRKGFAIALRAMGLE
jgi:hypothetical protein